VTDVLIRGLDEPMLRALKERATRNQRSVQQEIRAILSETLEAEDYQARKRRFYEWAKAFGDQLAASGRTFSDSALDIRRDRDTNHGRDA